MRNREGISTFLATLLMMVLAVSAGVIIYAYSMGYLGGFSGAQKLGAMSIDEYNAIDSVNGDNITAFVRNIGKTTITLDRAYVNGVLVAENMTAEIIKGEVEKVTVRCYNETGSSDTDGGDSYDLESGKNYEIKIISDDNTQVRFSIKVD